MLERSLAFFVACSVVGCGAPPTAAETHDIASNTPNPPKAEPPGAPDKTAPSTEPGAPSPTTTTCRTEDPFGPLTRIDELSSPAQSEGRATLSADELTIIFERDFGTTTSLMIATRTAIGQPFSTPRTAMSTPGMRLMQPSLSADGLSLYYARSYYGGQDIQRAQRKSVSDAFTAGMNLFFANGSGAKDFYPFIKDDQLWFTRSNSNASDIYRADESSGTFGMPFRVAELSTTDDDFGIVLTRDDRAAYFVRSVTILGERFYDTYVATRATKTDRFEAARIVPELMQAGTVTVPSWISADGCRLYVASDRAGTSSKFDLYVTSRAPR